MAWMQVFLMDAHWRYRVIYSYSVRSYNDDVSTLFLTYQNRKVSTLDSKAKRQIQTHKIQNEEKVKEERKKKGG